MQPITLTSRADLLRCMKRCQTVEEKQLAAQLLGYEWLASHQEKPIPQAIAFKGFEESQVGNPNVIEQVADSQEQAQRPPERFYAVTHREVYSDVQDHNDLPACLQGVEALSDDDLTPFEQGEPLEHQPLVPRQRLLPFLRATLRYSLGKRLDIPRLIQQVARLQPVQCVPRKPHVLPAGRVYVLLDLNKRLLPFWQDAHDLCEKLVRQHGKNGVHIRVLEDTPNGRYYNGFDEQPVPEAWSPLKTPCVVLIVSDLGQLAGKNSAIQKSWLYFLQQLARQGIFPVVLSPVSSLQQSHAFQTVAQQTPWGRNTSLKPQRFSFDDEQQVAGVRRVLGWLSVAVHVEPVLLRAMLACLPVAQANHGVEARVYWHEDVVWGYTAIALKPEKRDEYRALFRAESAALQRAILELVRQHHIGQFPAVWAEEVLNAQPLVNFPLAELADLERAEAFMTRFTRRFAQQHTPTGMAQFARRHLQRLAKDAQGNVVCKTRYSSALYGLAYREALRNGEAVPAGYDVGIVSAMVAQAQQAQRYRIMQVGESLYLKRTAQPTGLLFGQSGLLFGQSSKLQMGKYFSLNQERTSVRDISVGSLIDTFESRQDRLLLDIDGKQQFVPTNLQEPLCHLLAVGTIRLETGTERLLIEQVTKPTWAHEIYRDSAGLSAVLYFAGEHYHFRWQSPDGFTVMDAQWQLVSKQVRHKVGFDQYGLYVDLTIKNITQRFRWIKSGTFLMGSPKTEKGRYKDEVQHEVTLTQGFWLGETTVTQALWQAVMGNNPSYFRDNPNNPVEKVSWNDTQNLLKKLNALIPNLQAKLPTEAQWEYACRAGTTTPFSFGNNITPEQVNYDGNYPYIGSKLGRYRRKTVPVKSLPANPWGLYEMHGNVWEWCQDVWQEKLPTMQVTYPMGIAGGDQAGVGNVVRGGSWDDNARSCRSTMRAGHIPVHRNDVIGFRLCLGHESPYSNPSPEGRWAKSSGGFA